MTTTPDYRIRADWTLPAETDAPPPTVAPDTSTIAGKVRVMDASARGESVQQRAIAPFVNATNCDWAAHDGEWNWSVFDYRIAPPPPERMALAEARRSVETGGWARGSIAERLVREIDVAPVITAHPSDFGTTEFKFSAGAVPPGRYRLVRDES